MIHWTVRRRPRPRKRFFFSVVVAATIVDSGSINLSGTGSIVASALVLVRASALLEGTGSLSLTVAPPATSNFVLVPLCNVITMFSKVGTVPVTAIYNDPVVACTVLTMFSKVGTVPTLVTSGPSIHGVPVCR